MTKTFQFDETGKLIHHKRPLKPKEPKPRKEPKPHKPRSIKPKSQKYIKKKDRIHLMINDELDRSPRSQYYDEVAKYDPDDLLP